MTLCMLFNPSGHHWKNIAIKYILLYKNGDIRGLFKSASYSSEQIKLVQMLYLYLNYMAQRHLPIIPLSPMLNYPKNFVRNKLTQP